MAEEITNLESPIDAIHLIHKALRAEAATVEKMVNEIEVGGALQPFKLAFNSWATALVYHAEQEDRFLTHSLKHYHRPSRNGVAPRKGPGQPSGPVESPDSDGSRELLAKVRHAMVAQEDELHKELVEKVQDVLSVLQEDIGTTSVIRRTRQHLYRQVVALRIALEDHLDSEEALVLPMARRRMDEHQQLELAKELLIDQQAQEPRWMVDWISSRLASGEQRMLAELEDRFQGLVSPPKGVK